MGGMSKKRRFGSPGSKTVINEEEEGETGHVMGEKRNTDKTTTGIQWTAQVGLLVDIGGGQVQG